MARNNETALMEFYKQCKEKGYTDMTDDKQSLKAKVIARDLGIKYKMIGDLYDQAEVLYKEKERLQSTNGIFLFELDDSDTDRPDKKIALYRRSDGTLYHIINDNRKKIEGAMNLSVQGSQTFSFTYNPSQTVYTGATVGGITTGGFHQTEATISERAHSSGNAYLTASSEGIGFEVMLVKLSSQMCEKFKRSLTANERETKKITCYSSGGAVTGLMKSGFMPKDYTTQLTYATYAIDEKRLPASLITRYYNMLVDIINGRYPETEEELYKKAVGYYNSADTSEKLKTAENKFREIAPFYQEAEHMAEKAKKRYETVLQEEKEARILEEEAQEKARKKGLKVFLFAGIPLILLCAAAIFFLNKVVIPNQHYKQAVSLMEQGQYEEAITAFESLGDYEDSRDQIRKAELEIKEQEKADAYRAAEELFLSGQYEEAEKAFQDLGTYQDSESRAEECTAMRYRQAQALLSEGRYDEAVQAFTELGEYEDSQTQILEATFQKAKNMISEGRYEEAYNVLLPMKEYSNVSDYLNSYHFLPILITARSNTAIKTYEFTYDEYGTMIKAVYNLNGYEINVGVFDEDGKLIGTELGTYYSDKAGTGNSTYAYEPDNTVTVSFWDSNEAVHRYDEFGNMVEGYGSGYLEGKTFYYDYTTDEHHNRTDNAENTYENGRLVSVFYSQGNLRISSTVTYAALYNPRQEPDNDTIWRNIRLLCGESIWYR